LYTAFNTLKKARQLLNDHQFKRGPDEEGIETTSRLAIFSLIDGVQGSNADLMKKGLRPASGKPATLLAEPVQTRT
jgi:hypothetical protein